MIKNGDLRVKKQRMSSFFFSKTKSKGSITLVIQYHECQVLSTSPPYILYPSHLRPFTFTLLIIFGWSSYIKGFICFQFIRILSENKHALRNNNTIKVASFFYGQIN